MSSVYIKRASRHLEGECFGEFRIRVLELKIVNLVFLNIFSHFYLYFYLFYYLGLEFKVIVWYPYLFSFILSFQSLYRIYSSISLYIQH